MKKIITHFIYDMDGLLLDTEPFYTQATQEIVSRYGKRFDWELKSKMMGRPALESAKILVDTLELPITPEEYLQKRNFTLMGLFPTSSCRPGVRELVSKADKAGIPQGIATSSSSKNYMLKVQSHKALISVFSVVVTGDDPELKRGKPAPDIYLLAAKRMNAKPENCLIFEDSPSGVSAGIAAGMEVVAVPDSNMDRSLFEDKCLMLNSLEEFDFSVWDVET